MGTTTKTTTSTTTRNANTKQVVRKQPIWNMAVTGNNSNTADSSAGANVEAKPFPAESPTEANVPNALQPSQGMENVEAHHQMVAEEPVPHDLSATTPNNMGNVLNRPTINFG